jgi:hypothetical protein
MYAKIIDNTLQYPQADEFRGIPHWETNDAALRRRQYLPLVGETSPREGYTATPSRWHVVQQSETRIEPRQQTVEDYEKDEETGESRKVGEHTEMVDTEITVDTSYIQIDDWQYTELPPPPEPPQPSEEVRQATAAIINRIAELVLNYDAIEDAKALDNFNIENLLALAKAKNVTPQDMALLKEDLVLLKTDLEGKMDATWYQIWNGWLKGAIAEALRNMVNKRKAASAAGK